MVRMFWKTVLICLVMTGSPALAHDGTHSNNSAASKATLEMLKGTEDDRALYQQLRSSWSEIFPSGNRNAGGAVFFKHILDRYTDRDTFMAMNRFYCPVSGSLVDAGSEPEFVYADDAATGKPVCGSLYRCCWPCSCDIMRLASVQQMPFTFDSGPEDIHVFVIDNPCAKDDFQKRYLAVISATVKTSIQTGSTALTARLSLACCMTDFSVQQNRLPGSGCTA